MCVYVFVFFGDTIIKKWLQRAEEILIQNLGGQTLPMPWHLASSSRGLMSTIPAAAWAHVMGWHWTPDKKAIAQFGWSTKERQIPLIMGLSPSSFCCKTDRSLSSPLASVFSVLVGTLRLHFGKLGSKEREWLSFGRKADSQAITDLQVHVINKVCVLNDYIKWLHTHEQIYNRRIFSARGQVYWETNTIYQNMAIEAKHISKCKRHCVVSSCTGLHNIPNNDHNYAWSFIIKGNFKVHCI